MFKTTPTTSPKLLNLNQDLLSKNVFSGHDVFHINASYQSLSHLIKFCLHVMDRNYDVMIFFENTVILGKAEVANLLTSPNL